MARCLALPALVLFAALLSAGAKSGTLERTCTGMGSSYGHGAVACVLKFSGEIGSGDADALADAVRFSPAHVELLDLDSPGGDPFEALKMSDVLNRYFIAASTGTCWAEGDDCPSREQRSCASACALLFMTANDRLGSNVYLHRPTFPPAYFASLSGAEAENAYDSAVEQLKSGLRQRGVPDDQIQRMMSVASTAVQRLGAGYNAYSPWLDEWLLAKCGPASLPRLICETDAILAEQLKSQGKSLPGWKSQVGPDASRR